MVRRVNMRSNGKVGGVFVILFLSVNLSTVNKEFPVTINPEDQRWPAIFKDTVVYVHKIGTAEIIYTYNLSTAQKSGIHTGPVNNSRPAIYGDIVVWRSSCCYIYRYDLSQQRRIEIDVDSYPLSHPAIYGDIVVWEDLTADIHCYSLSKLQEIPLMTTQSTKDGPPAIYKDIVVWRNYRNGNWDIYGCNISEILKIEPLSTPQSPLSQIYGALKRVTFTPSEVLYIFLGAIAIVIILILRWREGKKEVFLMRR